MLHFIAVFPTYHSLILPTPSSASLSILEVGLLLLKISQLGLSTYGHTSQDFHQFDVSELVDAHFKKMFLWSRFRGVQAYGYKNKN